MNTDSDQLQGNRLALFGAIFYLLEWVVIIPAGAPDSMAPVTNPAALVALYAEHAVGTKILAAWLGLVLLGRIAFAAGLRGSLRQSARNLPLMDFALGAMLVSVVLEVAGYGLAGAAASLADHAVDATAIVALNEASGWLNQLVFSPLGVFVAVGSLAMLKSNFFPRWLCWLGLISGSVFASGGVILAAAFRTTSGVSNVGDTLVGVGGLGFWVWMLATGILLFRRAGRRTLA